MRYLPKSQADRETMLRELGCKSIDDLFAGIPAEYRLKSDLNIPRQYAESEIVEFFRERADRQDAVRRLEQFMVLFPEAVLSLLSRVEIDQAPDVLARGRCIKDVVTLAA